MKKISFLLLSLLGVVFAMVPTGANAFDFSGVASLVSGGTGGGIMGIIISLFGFGMSGFCWFCDLYKTLFDIMNTLATTVSKSLAHDFLLLLGVGMLFFIAFKVGSTVVKLQEVDLMQFLGELFKQLGRAIIAAAFLLGTVQMYHYLISPFLAYSLALTHKIMITRNAGTVTEIVTKLLGGGKSGADFMPNVTAGILGEGSGMAFSNEIRAQLIGILELVSASLISGLVIGAAIILIGFADGFLNIIPNFQIVTVGFIIVGAYFSVYVAVPFKLIDVMVRLTFVAALTPLWIVLWVFPATVSYTKNAWEMLLNCCACIICLGVVLVMALEIMEYMLPGKEGIIMLLLGGLDMLATGQMNLINPELLQTAALGLLVVNLIKNSSVIATQIVKSYGTQIGDGLADRVQKDIGSMGNLGAALGGAAAAVTANGLKEGLKFGRDITQGARNTNWGRRQIDNFTDAIGIGPINANSRIGAANRNIDAINKKEREDGHLTHDDIQDRKDYVKERGELMDRRKAEIDEKLKTVPKGSQEAANLRAERDILDFYTEKNDKGEYINTYGTTGIENLQDRLAIQYKENPEWSTEQALNNIKPDASKTTALSVAHESVKGYFEKKSGQPQMQQPTGK